MFSLKVYPMVEKGNMFPLKVYPTVPRNIYIESFFPKLL